jgi:hypothetical protein
MFSFLKMREYVLGNEVADGGTDPEDGSGGGGPPLPLHHIPGHQLQVQHLSNMSSLHQ